MKKMMGIVFRHAKKELSDKTDTVVNQALFTVKMYAYLGLALGSIIGIGVIALICKLLGIF